jgi:hypothetical protein
MRIVIQYFPEAQDAIDAGAMEPTLTESVPTVEMAYEFLGRLERAIDKTEGV